MSRDTSRKLMAMVCIDAFLAAVTVVFAVLHGVFAEGWMLTLFVTFLTISYHFIMRLAVGQVVTLIYRKKEFDLGSPGFRIYAFEAGLYKRLKVRKWKTNLIIAKPEQFDVGKNSMASLLHNMAQAELVHRIIMALSFVPLALIIPYGVPAVFILTLFLACLIDLQFVIVQRYNRPRVMRIMKFQEDRQRA